MASQATLDRLCAEFDSPNEHITAAVLLLEQNATPAYLSRYRRHELGNLPEERLAAIAERLHLLNELEQRRATILQQAEERGAKTEELEQTLANTADQDLLDDYYQSMRPRRRGIAMQMEEKKTSSGQIVRACILKVSHIPAQRWTLCHLCALCSRSAEFAVF